MSKQLRMFLYGFVSFNILWLILAVCINSDALTSPIDVYKSIGNTVTTTMLTHIIASSFRILISLIISLIIAIPIGIIIADQPRINKIVSPLLYFSYPIPKLALLPIVMLLMGIGEAAKITMLVLILVFQIIVAVRDGIFNIPRENYNVLTSLGASKTQVLRWLTFPAILPEILTSMRIAIGTAVSVLFFTETFGTDYGLGFYIVDAWMRLAYTEMYSGILILSLLGFIFFFAIDLLSFKLCKWKE